MKALHVISSVSAARGGPSRAILEIERALAERGIDVTTVTTDDDGPGRRLPVTCGEAVRTAHATRWYFQFSSQRYLASIGLARWLRANIRAFDVVHVHAVFSFAPVIAAFLARRAGVPYIIRPLGVLSPYGMTTRRPHMKRLSMALIERRLIESAAAVHFTSLAEQAETQALELRCKGVVIPLGIDVGNGPGSAHSERKRGETANILFLSRIDPKKNIEGLLHAVALLRSRRFAAHLTIAGDGASAYVDQLKALVDRLGIAEHVDWLGFVAGERKASALAAASVFALPSYSENFGIAVAEALAAGLPAVVSEGVAISREIGAAGAGVVTGTDAESIAAGIERAFENETGYRAMSSSARRLIESTFSNAAMGRSLESLYFDVAKSSVASAT